MRHVPIKKLLTLIVARFDGLKELSDAVRELLNYFW
jgi:hypothetical protein